MMFRDWKLGSGCKPWRDLTLSVDDKTSWYDLDLEPQRSFSEQQAIRGYHTLFSTPSTSSTFRCLDYRHRHLGITAINTLGSSTAVSSTSTLANRRYISIVPSTSERERSIEASERPLNVRSSSCRTYGSVLSSEGTAVWSR